ncbi:hypothetical protein [Sinorhizobium medicae]
MHLIIAALAAEPNSFSPMLLRDFEVRQGTETPYPALACYEVKARRPSLKQR